MSHSWNLQLGSSRERRQSCTVETPQSGGWNAKIIRGGTAKSGLISRIPLKLDTPMKSTRALTYAYN